MALRPPPRGGSWFLLTPQPGGILQAHYPPAGTAVPRSRGAPSEETAAGGAVAGATTWYVKMTLTRDQGSEDQSISAMLAVTR